MKLLLTLALFLASVMTTLVPTVSFAVDRTISANCRSGAPASYSRPAAYCDVIASNDSLLTPSDNPPPEVPPAE